MGRHAGFISMEACAAHNGANVCLIPEFQWDLYGNYNYILKILKVYFKNCFIF